MWSSVSAWLFNSPLLALIKILRAPRITALLLRPQPSFFYMQTFVIAPFYYHECFYLYFQHTCSYCGQSVCQQWKRKKGWHIAKRCYLSSAALKRLKPDDQQISHSALCRGGPFLLLTATIFNIYSGVCIYLIIIVYCCFVLRARIIVHHQN